MGKKVAVIGAGQSGLVALKTLHQHGHRAICFERLADIGGLWNYNLHTNKQGESQGYVNLPSDNQQPLMSSYNSLKFISLSHTSIFSDFIPADMDLYKVNKYMSPTEYLEYLKRYAEFHSLYSYINFNSHVIQVQKSLSGWVVTYKSDEKLHEEGFDFVFVASGDKLHPHIPQVSNMHKFKGLVIHSSQVRKEDVLFPGKSVLVVGGRSSGSDMIANALRHKASKIYWIVGRNWEKNQWCLDRFVASGKINREKKPFQAFLTRFEYDVHNANTETLRKFFVPIRQKNKEDKPKEGDTLGINDSILLTQAMEKNQITFVPTISSISENGEFIHFTNKSCASDVDIIIFATGFSRRFPYLSKIWSNNEQSTSLLYKLAVCPQKELDGMAFISFVRGFVSFALVAEMQCKWLCNTMLVKTYNPDGTLYNEYERKYMESHISQQLKNGREAYQLNGLIYDPFEYYDSLFSEIGYKVPSCNELLKRGEIELAVALYHGPLTGAQYQLSDQNDPSFEKAKNFLITVAKVILQDTFQLLVEKYTKLSSYCTY